jgi:primosomal protein N' (replication factor Y) (superfamily II helicase)
MFSLCKSKCKVPRMGKDSLDLFGAPKALKAVPVMVPLPVPKPYSYLVPDGVHVEEGSIVQVPLGPRQVFGVVWKDNAGDSVDPKKLKPITLVFDCPPLKGEMQAFLDWIAAYTLSPPGLVARMALRAPTAFEPEPMVEGLRLTDMRPERMTPARMRVISLAEEAPAWTRLGLAHAAGVSASVVDGLTAQGVFEPLFLAPPPVTAEPDPDYAQPALEETQREAADSLIAAVRARTFGVTLIDGVTGSGKTEVYFEAIAETLRQGRQVLILLPEIALTPAFLERFQDRFGAKPGQWHSDLAPNRS